MKEYVCRYLMNSLREITYIITKDILLGATEDSFLRNLEGKKKENSSVSSVVKGRDIILSEDNNK